MREFKSYHPLVNFIYFVAVIGFAMLLMHPVCLLVSALSAFSCSVIVKGKKAALFGVLGILPMMIIAALINPLFNHQGITILAYLPDGNPLTLESVVYGVGAALMLCGMICWFSCYNAIMTEDKLMYLFGKIMPSLSLVFSMIMRFVPRFREQLRNIVAAQRGIGLDVSQGGLIKRIKQGIGILSVMMSWMFENSIETAASMKCRGYGLKDRTFFSLYFFTRRDVCALVFIGSAALYVLVGYECDAVYFSYFPMLVSEKISAFSVSIYVVYLALCVMPIFIEVREVIRWNALKSRI